jgi:rod shape-determining protein MreD
VISRYLSVPLLLIAAILQSTLMPDFQIQGGRADLIFTLILGWALLTDSNQGVLWALIGGVCQDLVNGLPLGLSAMALIGVVFGISRFISPLDRSNWLIPPVLAAIGTGAYHLALIGLYTLFGHTVPIVYSLLNITLPTIVMNAVLMLVVFRILGVLHGATAPKRVGALTIQRQNR